jgi:hypothetical protein
VIPANLNRAHVLAALRELDANPPPPSRESVDYRLEHEGKSYPPKYVISVANRFVNGTDLDPSTFAAGEAETNPLLRKLGFTIRKLSENDAFASTSGTTFETVRGAVALEGHHFAVETLSHYLLALQAKRFAILSGVSGTGKTRLAMAVAEQFPAVLKERVAQSLPPDTMQLKVEPYMLKYQRFVVPAALAARIKVADDGRLLVRFPEGEEMLACRAYETKAQQLLLRGRASKWFTATFKVGDVFGARVIEGAGDAPSQLELSLLADRIETRRVANACVIAVRPDWTDHRALLGYFNPLRKRYETTPFLRFLLEARNECERAVADGRNPSPFFAILDEMTRDLRRL